jgi:hypothetical protein
MKYPSCHEKSPRHAKWLERVKQLEEEEGCTRNDAEAIADMDFDDRKRKGHIKYSFFVKKTNPKTNRCIG